MPHFALAASVAVYLAFERPVTRALQRRLRDEHALSLSLKKS
jgi:hypothetical protein